MDGNAQLPVQLDQSVDAILRETARSNPILRFKKGAFLIGEDKIQLGQEYVAHPLDWSRGWCRWDEGSVVEQKLGRVADGYRPPEKEELGEGDWQRINVLPLEDVTSGEYVLFISNSFGGKLAVEKLANATARAVKAGRGEGTPLIRLAVADFKSKQYGTITRPAFEIVSGEPDKIVAESTDPNDEIPF
jgi:hypothetical protein